MPPQLQWVCSAQVQSPTMEVCPPSAFWTGGHCLCDPSHSRMGGVHLCHVNPLTETCRRGSGPTSPSTQERHTDFTDVFSEEAFAHIPPRKAWDHAIELHPDANLPRGRTFPLSPAEQKEFGIRMRLYGMVPCLTRGEMGKGFFGEDVCKVFVALWNGALGWVDSLGLSLFCKSL